MQKKKWNVRETYINCFFLGHKLRQESNGIANTVSINGCCYAIPQDFFFEWGISAHETVLLLPGMLQLKKNGWFQFEETIHQHEDFYCAIIMLFPEITSVQNLRKSSTSVVENCKMNFISKTLKIKFKLIDKWTKVPLNYTLKQAGGPRIKRKEIHEFRNKPKQTRRLKWIDQYWIAILCSPCCLGYIHYTFCAGPNDKVYNDTTRYIYKRVSQ